MPANEVQPISAQPLRDGLGDDHVVGDHAEAPAEPRPAGRPGADRQHHLVGLDRAVFGAHHRRPRPIETGHRGAFEDPNTALQGDASQATGQTGGLHDRAVIDEPSTRDPRRVGDLASLLHRERSHPIAESTRLQERRGPLATGPLLPGPRSDPQDPVVMEPGVDVVVGEPRSRLTDRVRHRVGIAQSLVVAEEPAQRLDVPPGRGEEATVAPAGAAAADVLLQQRDAHRGFAGRELDRRPEPGEPPADDADVGDHVRLEGRARFAGVRAEGLLEPEAPRRARVGHRQARAHVRRRCG